MAIWFNSEIKDFDIQHKKKVKNWISTLLDQHKLKTGIINFIFLDDAGLLKLNIEYLNHNTFTDIISFDYSANDLISGDIYLSIERIRENADNLNISFNEELKRVIIHGILHLIGFKDSSESEKRIMRLKEDQALSNVKDLLIAKA